MVEFGEALENSVRNRSAFETRQYYSLRIKKRLMWNLGCDLGNSSSVTQTPLSCKSEGKIKVNVGLVDHITKMLHPMASENWFCWEENRVSSDSWNRSLDEDSLNLIALSTHSDFISQATSYRPKPKLFPGAHATRDMRKSFGTGLRKRKPK